MWMNKTGTSLLTDAGEKEWGKKNRKFLDFDRNYSSCSQNCLCSTKFFLWYI